MDEQTWSQLTPQERFESVIAELFPDASTDDPWAWDTLDHQGEPAYIGKRRRDG